jgi:hypothetical protein
MIDVAVYSNFVPLEMIPSCTVAVLRCMVLLYVPSSPYVPSTSEPVTLLHFSNKSMGPMEMTNRRQPMLFSMSTSHPQAQLSYSPDYHLIADLEYRFDGKRFTITPSAPC